MPAPPKLEQTRRARGLVSSPSSGDRIASRTLPPTPDLADVVLQLWVSSWDLRGETAHETLLLSDPSLNVVFETGDHEDARIVGVWTRLWRRTLEGTGRIRAVKLRPGAVRAFFDLPATAFTNRIVPLTELVGREAKTVARAVFAPESDDDGLAGIEAWLRKRRRTAEASDVSLAVRLVERIARDTDVTSVERLAEVGGVHRRTLQRLFREHVGATPKSVIRRNRLQEVAVRIERGQAVSFAALAADLGYADQAHLARDFKSVTGMSPRDFAQKMRG